VCVCVCVCVRVCRLHVHVFVHICVLVPVYKCIYRENMQTCIYLCICEFADHVWVFRLMCVST